MYAGLYQSGQRFSFAGVGMYGGGARFGLGDVTSAGDPSSDPTPIPAGSWITIGFYQNVLGGFNSFLQSWTSLANQWAGYVTWPTQALLIRDSTAYQDAILQAQITNDTTVAAVYAVLNAISPDVSIRFIIVNGSIANAKTLAAQSQANADFLSNLMNDPIAAVGSLASTIVNTAAPAIASSVALIAGVVLVGVFLVKQIETTRTGRRLAARV